MVSFEILKPHVKSRIPSAGLMTSGSERLPQRQRFVGGGAEVAGKNAGGDAATLRITFHS